MKTFTLNGTWQLRRADCDCSHPTTIPGSVISGLLENGIIDDPYYRMNELPTLELLRHDYIFSRTFTVDHSFLAEKRLSLVCDGLDTIAEVRVNGTLVGNANNMHRRWYFDCTDALREGENTIEIAFSSPLVYIEQYVPAEGKETTFHADGVIARNQYIRKAHSMFGWDWGIKLPDMGIWRDIYLLCGSDARIDSTRVTQHHCDGRVTLSVDVDIDAVCDAPCSVHHTLTDPDGNLTSFVGETSIEQPKLWWPNGIGEHPLYTLTTELLLGDTVIDTRTEHIGLRTITVCRDKDQWGEQFAFCVNGVKIFAFGANYIPEDAIYSRIDDARLEYLVQSAVDANFNMLRIWGGGYYPCDKFMELCDRNGILVWMDFMFACNVYELTDSLRDNIRAEVIYNATRLRNHACLALWCGNNEIESAWDEWDGMRDLPESLRADYLEIFEDIIPNTLRTVDDVTFYWPSSPSSGGGFDDPADDNRGDVHYWKVWHGLVPFDEYEQHYFRFCSEFGFQSFPCLQTVESFTLPEDRNIFTRVMENHQKNGTANGRILNYLSQYYRYPKDFDSLLYVSQLMQADAMRCNVEHLRRHRGRCMGALYWQLNDNWPVASWAGMDYYGRWKPLHYTARRFYAPVAGSLHRDGGALTAHVQNETAAPVDVRVTLSILDMAMNCLSEQRFDLHIDAFSVCASEPFDCSELIAGREHELIACALFELPDGRRERSIVHFVPMKHLDLPSAELSLSVSEQDDTITLTVSTDQLAAYVWIEPVGFDAILSDNCFWLTDTQPVTLTARIVGDRPDELRFTVRSLRDSY